MEAGRIIAGLSGVLVASRCQHLAFCQEPKPSGGWKHTCLDCGQVTHYAGEPLTFSALEPWPVKDDWRLSP